MDGAREAAGAEIFLAISSRISAARTPRGLGDIDAELKLDPTIDLRKLAIPSCTLCNVLNSLVALLG